MLRNVVILITANAGNDFQTVRRPQKGTATARNPPLWVESLKSAVYGFESLDFFSGNDPQETARKSLVIIDYSSALSPPSQPGRAL